MIRENIYSHSTARTIEARIKNDARVFPVLAYHVSRHSPSQNVQYSTSLIFVQTFVMYVKFLHRRGVCHGSVVVVMTSTDDLLNTGESSRTIRISKFRCLVVEHSNEILLAVRIPPDFVSIETPHTFFRMCQLVRKWMPQFHKNIAVSPIETFVIVPVMWC